jgi:Fe-S cluster biogenesis protein NfuA
MADTDAADFRQRMQRLEILIQEMEALPDARTRDRVRDLIQTLLDLHAAGLAKLLDYIAASGEPGQAILGTLASDELTSALLTLHGLHPVDFETRVRQALDSVRPYLRSHGGNVELIGISDGVLRLRMQGSCHSCPSSAQTLKQSIEEAILARAPDAAAIEVEGVTEPPAPSAGAFVPVEQLTVRNGHASTNRKERIPVLSTEKTP